MVEKFRGAVLAMTFTNRPDTYSGLQRDCCLWVLFGQFNKHNAQIIIKATFQKVSEHALNMHNAEREQEIKLILEHTANWTLIRYTAAERLKTRIMDTKHSLSMLYSILLLFLYHERQLVIMSTPDQATATASSKLLC